MTKSIFSPLWYRAASLKPRLRSHLTCHRHHYRGQLWYVLQDPIGGKYHRFSPSAYQLIAKMDGEVELQMLWEQVVGKLGDDAPTQDETLSLLGQLYASNALASDVPPDTQELFERYRKQKFQTLKQKLISPLSIKIPLFDPEPFLARWTWLARPLFSWLGVLILLAAAVTAGLLGVMHWNAFTEDISSNVLSPMNLMWIWLLFPLVKALHEFGHAFATKIWGGEVHEMGVMFLVFIPVPYVDASSASAFRERYKRVLVGAAGMLVEVCIAALALLIWVYAESSLVKSLAYNVVLIAGVSTLLFNANPLLRFDGYYIFADWLEIPNLGTRANKYMTYLTQKYAFGMKEVKSPVDAPGEAGWFLFYAIASYCYRVFITIAIALFVASSFFFVGVLLAALAIFNMFLLPLLKGLKYVLIGVELQKQRVRAVGLTSLLIISIAVSLAMVPAPSWTSTEGVVWLPEENILKAGTACFIKALQAPSGSQVSRRQPIFLCENIELSRDLLVAEARLRELNIEYIAHRRTDFLQSEISRDEMKSVQAEISAIKDRMAKLAIRSPSKGVLHIPFSEDVVGRYVEKGEVLGYVINTAPASIRAVVTQDAIDQVRHRTKKVELVFPQAPHEVVVGSILREIPGASATLPSPALGSQGGGPVPVDPRTEGGTATFEKIFQFEIALPEAQIADRFGGRVFIRFQHENETVAHQWFRSLRQLFLDQFNV